MLGSFCVGLSCVLDRPQGVLCQVPDSETPVSARGLLPIGFLGRRDLSRDRIRRRLRLVDAEKHGRPFVFLRTEAGGSDRLIA